MLARRATWTCRRCGAISWSRQTNARHDGRAPAALWESVLVSGGGGAFGTSRSETCVDAVLERDLAEVQRRLVIANVVVALVGLITIRRLGGIGVSLGDVDRTASRGIRRHARSELLAIGLHARQVDVGHVGGTDHGVSVSNTGETEGGSQGGGGNNRFETHFSQPL